MAKPKPKPVDDRKEERMLRKVVHLPVWLNTDAEEYLETQRRNGSLMRLPELVRVALHAYMKEAAGGTTT
ncbi:MAG: hypothetical protein P1P84_02565 [Deferrisomatales bacterium]|nr:hypothetical protein [Deferrisomatales bacterium]